MTEATQIKLQNTIDRIAGAILAGVVCNKIVQNLIFF